MEKDFIYIDQYGLLGGNYYYDRRDSYDITAGELAAIGLVDNRVQVHKDIIEPLMEVDKTLQKDGHRLYIKEGYRSREVYELAYKKRVAKLGQYETERLLNMKDMPHANGKTVDMALWDPKTNKEVYLRDGADGADAYFLDFYKNKTDDKSSHFQKLQEFVINIMMDHGFRLGTKKEYWHFAYDPQSPRNYPLVELAQ